MKSVNHEKFKSTSVIAPCADFKSKRDFSYDGQTSKMQRQMNENVPGSGSSVWEKTSIPVSGNNSDRKTHCLNSLNR